MCIHRLFHNLYLNCTTKVVQVVYLVCCKTDNTIKGDDIFLSKIEYMNVSLKLLRSAQSLTELSEVTPFKLQNMMVGLLYRAFSHFLAQVTNLCVFVLCQLG